MRCSSPVFFAAYVDESYDLNIGVYILTASIVDLADAEEARYVLRSLQQGGEKLHWSKEPQQRRNEVTKAVSALGFASVSVIGSGVHVHAERARRKCMEVLLPELEGAGVETVTFEARQARNDKQDRELIAACRRKRLLSSRLHASFLGGESEPLLRLPDIVCGTVLATQRGDDSYLQQFGSTAHLLFIEAR